jgi:hypothetical protein
MGFRPRWGAGDPKPSQFPAGSSGRTPVRFHRVRHPRLDRKGSKNWVEVSTLGGCGPAPRRPPGKNFNFPSRPRRALSDCRRASRNSLGETGHRLWHQRRFARGEVEGKKFTMLKTWLSKLPIKRSRNNSSTLGVIGVAAGRSVAGAVSSE